MTTPMPVTSSMVATTGAAIVRICRAGIIENAAAGKWKRAQDAADSLARSIHPTTTVEIERRGRVILRFPAETLNEASATFAALRDRCEWYAEKCPRVWLVVDGERRGYISQNGKAWEGTKWVPGSAPLFDPFAESEA